MNIYKKITWQHYKLTFRMKQGRDAFQCIQAAVYILAWNQTKPSAYFIHFFLLTSLHFVIAIGLEYSVWGSYSALCASLPIAQGGLVVNHSLCKVIYYPTTIQIQRQDICLLWIIFLFILNCYILSVQSCDTNWYRNTSKSPSVVRIIATLCSFMVCG